MPTCTLVDAAGLDRAEVLRLYDSVGWTAYTDDPDTLHRALTGSHRLAVARADGVLIGLARSISDGATIVYLQDILVHPDHHRTGLGRELVTMILGQYPGIRQQVLITDNEPGQRAFYESLGFTEAHDMEPGSRAFLRFA
ncbi:MAG: GNAT family N-acetyltransferase [Propionibacteriaceae bacterium]